VYFRERAAQQAQEQYHSGLLRHDGSPDLGYDEAQRLYTEKEEMDRVSAHPVQAEIALVFSYEDLWALQIQPHRKGFNYLRLLFVYYAALQALGLPVNVVSNQTPLDGYRLVVAPCSHLGLEAFAADLEAYAEKGGSVLLGIRSGFKTPSGRAIGQPLPGVYRALSGITVSGWHSLPPGIDYDIESSVPGLEGKATIWAESLEEEGAEEKRENEGLAPLARYTSGPLAGKAGLSERRVGAGRVLYLGWYPSLEQARALLEYLAAQIGLERLAQLPGGLVAARRGPYTILFNFTDTPQEAIVARKTFGVGPRDIQVIEITEQA
jgi:beta-galactosidase